jgi:hypothetical protein
MSKKNILLLVLADPSTNPRPYRLIKYLNEKCSLDILSYPIKEKINYREYYEIKRSKSFKILHKLLYELRFFLFYISCERIRDFINCLTFQLGKVKKILKSKSYDFIIVEDLFFLPEVMKYKESAKVIFDAREYYPSQNDESLLWRLSQKPLRIDICTRFLKKCDHVFTVSDGLMIEYKTQFNINPFVIHSTPYKCDIEPIYNFNNPVRMVYHGLANKNRELQNIIKIVNALGNGFTLDLFLVGKQANIKEIKKFIINNRVKILKPLDFCNIVPTLNKYDLGFCFYKPTSFNLLNCLPNKFFEYIQAKVPVVIGPSPCMMSIVQEYNIGVISDEFTIDSMVNALSSISFTKISNYKKNIKAVAKKFCFENEVKSLHKIIFDYG